VKVTETDGKITGVSVSTDNTENKNNKVTSWSSTPSDTKYPSEKLVKDTIDGLPDITVTSSSVSDGTNTFNKYVHPTTAGNKHIPTGGSSGQVLVYGGSSGTASWGNAPADNTKADKVSNATSGNFAGLDSNGNLTDSEKKASDFATAAQGSKADSAIQGVKVNGTRLTPDSTNVVDILPATSAAYGVVQLGYVDL
jgi:hypothetical protein